ncbi:YebC/PmpR family DNA-binding transcriptional regulator [Iamia majanohamensis]|uniref:Probable transcriptional regulatory protein PO878_09590 n=1 Tax=Iamia majanohamensis TaxID=467976 RepID=A0AAF0BSV3_9ACTN|nr:YebC/PmpR family DNA-binding transcriptional regulator [Iamia majanohamensis]WCO68976.1 YebC/PmpR family DNA-binding transcriptional regulator [Iamia majanohamensis]
MSGHSKWATIKHKKGAADAKRGKLFAKLIRQVEVAARQGGADLDANPTLRTMYQKARDASVPLDTIERAVKRATGDLDGVVYEQITYEGYAPHGVAVLIDVLTDNRNRSGSEVRTIFSRAGGSLAEPGSVAWQFDRKGQVIVDREADEDELMLTALDAGAEDLTDDEVAWRVTCEPGDVEDVRKALEEADFTVRSSDTLMVAANLVPLEDASAARSVLALIDSLEDSDDVQDVHANFDIPDDVFASLDAG